MMKKDFILIFSYKNWKKDGSGGGERLPYSIVILLVENFILIWI
jgi:hypothetical protein